LLVAPLPVEPLSFGKPAANEFDVFLRCRNAALGLLLEGMQDVNHVSKLHRVYSTIGIRIVTISDPHHPCSTETLKGFSRRIGFTHLRRIESLPNIETDVLREGLEVPSR
jgi:hypothetical protein